MLSIVIPHYNTPQLLRRCLQSIPVRPDVQVIVVDDCSPDADRYVTMVPELQRPYLTYCSTPRGGSAGRARNVGLQQVRGEWVMFADADDYYAAGFADVVMAHLTADLDILYYNVYGQDERALLHQQIFDLYQTTGDETEVRYHIWAPWNKVFRTDFIRQHHLQFEEVPVGNDAMFCLRASRLARHYNIIADKLYCLTDNAGSITTRQMTFEREMAYTEVRTRITLFMTELGLQYKYGYHLFSVPRARRILADNGVRACVRYVGYIACHYGILRALIYNRKRRRYQAQHPQFIYCD